MLPGKGPHFPKPLDTVADLEVIPRALAAKDKLQYVFDAITLTRHKLEGKVPLIGFCGAPWTLMAYMIEGGGSKTFSKAKSWLYDRETASLDLLDRITAASIDYLVGQVAAGAQMLQVFESWAGELGPDLFSTYSLPFLRRIRSGVHERLVQLGIPTVPMVVFAKGAHYAIPDLAQSGYNVVGLDWTVDPRTARAAAGDAVSLQGNMDPCALYGSHDRIGREVRTMIDGFGTQRYIANLGHGMHPDHDPAALGAFVDEVHRYSRELNGSRATQ
eukprot:Opistho-2@68690